MNITQSKESDLSSEEDLHVDILECVKPGDHGVEKEVASNDLSSSSSSFNDSTCVPDDSGLGDEEAQSTLCQDYPSPSLCDGTQFYPSRKRKLRDDWRRFVGNTMWRCRWLELKVKEFQRQGRKYNKEIAKCYLMKQFELEKSRLEGSAAKSNPLSVQAQRVRVLKRRKRKRVEETTDVASYMSSHNLFSYAENRMPATASPHYHDLDSFAERKCTSKEAEIEDVSLVSEIKFSDDLLADVLRKINDAREKAQKLKRRADGLMSEPWIGIGDGTGPADAEDDGCRQPQPVHIGDLSIPEVVAPSQAEVAVRNVGQLVMDMSPNSFGSIFPILEDVEEEPGMNDGEELRYFREIINEITTRVPRLSSEEQDPALTISSTKRKRKRKRKRQPTWMSSSRTSARRRKASI